MDEALDGIDASPAVRAAVLAKLQPSSRPPEVSGTLAPPYLIAGQLWRQLVPRPMALSADELDDLRLLLQTDHLTPLLSLLEQHDAAFGEALLEVYRNAAAEGLAPAAYREQLRETAAKWGAGDWGGSAVAQTWQGSAVEAPLAIGGELLTYRVPEVAATWPYVEILTRDDERVRPNHRTLHGWVVAVTWEGITEVMPPYGYNCRCRPFRRTVAELEGRFGELLTGPFPIGQAQLDNFRAAGGADEDFPRELFVLAA